jgi:hypothetical protein
MTHAYVVRFVGGPLDGRVDSLAEPQAEPKPTLTHVHLHGGPKIVHHYDLQYAVEYGCEYRLRGSEEDADREEADKAE